MTFVKLPQSILRIKIFYSKTARGNRKTLISHIVPEISFEVPYKAKQKVEETN